MTNERNPNEVIIPIVNRKMTKGSYMPSLPKDGDIWLNTNTKFAYTYISRFMAIGGHIQQVTTHGYWAAIGRSDVDTIVHRELKNAEAEENYNNAMHTGATKDIIADIEARVSDCKKHITAIASDDAFDVANHLMDEFGERTKNSVWSVCNIVPVEHKEVVSKASLFPTNPIDGQVHSVIGQEKNPYKYDASMELWTRVLKSGMMETEVPTFTETWTSFSNTAPSTRVEQLPNSSFDDAMKLLED